MKPISSFVLVLVLVLDAARAQPVPLPADIAALIAAEKPLTPAQALVAMRTEPGLRVELAAAEPLVGDPVALAWDEKGRLFVAENHGYPTNSTTAKPLGIIAMLEDTKGNGTFDKRTVFASGLSYPNGLMCWRGGLIVTCAPEVFYLKDTDGNGIADVKRVLFTGFMTNSTTQIRVAHPTLAADGWIYLTSGLTGGKVTCPEHPERPAVEFTKSDTRFRPDTLEFETVPGLAQFGECFDDFGRKFTVDNRHPLQMVAMQPRYLKRNPYLAFSETIADVAASAERGAVYPLAKDQTTAGMMPTLLHAPHAGTFTSSCGIRIYGGDALPTNFYGSSFTCEPAQSLVQRQVISSGGAILKAVHAHPGTEVMVSADSWFRPVFAQNAPDGALYVASMYRKFIDHPQYVPADMRDKLDFNSGRDQGRIYRLVAEDKKIARKKFDLGKASTKQLVGELENPKVWWRETAFRLLLERRDPAAVKPLNTLLEKSKSPQARVLALRLLDALAVLSTDQLAAAMHDRHPGVRENALLIAEPVLDAPESVRAGGQLALGEPFAGGGSDASRLVLAALSLTDDSDARVRFQTLLTLGSHDYRSAQRRFAEVAVRDSGDRWTRAAALATAGRQSAEFLDAVLARIAFDPRAASPENISALVGETCRVVGASQPPEKLVPILAQLTSARGLDYAAQSAAVTGLGEALRSRKLSLTQIASASTVDAIKAREGLARLMRGALQLATDGAQPVPARQAAIGMLAFFDFATAGQPLQSLINPQQPTEIQTAVVKVLPLLAGSDAPKFLLEAARWKSFSPSVREAVLAALMSQTAGVEALLAAVESGAVAPTGIDPTRRAQLLKNRNKAVAAKAEELFKNLQGSDRMKVYEEYKSILTLKPNAANGHASFAKVCVQCHQLNGEGAKVGPDLTGVRNQPAEVLLLHILVPSYEIVAGFNAYEIETKDGRTATGLLASETPTSVMLRRALGEEETILRSNIATMAAGALSLMPDELEKTMSKQDLRDLIGFLKGE
ncbi:MAG: c-type cytochrome [Verrucomicrobia bacterium]|nr:c-type cytochrome [Verrucomicrobiota bacterium]